MLKLHEVQIGDYLFDKKSYLQCYKVVTWGYCGVETFGIENKNYIGGGHTLSFTVNDLRRMSKTTNPKLVDLLYG